MAYPTSPSQVGLTVAKNTLTDQLTNVTYSTTQTVTGVRFRDCQITVAAGATVTFVDCWFYLHTFANSGKVVFQNCEHGYDGTATAQDPIGGTWNPDDYAYSAGIGGSGDQEWVDTVIHYMQEGPRPKGNSGVWSMSGCWLGNMYIPSTAVDPHADGIQAIGQADGLAVSLADTYIDCSPAANVTDHFPSAWTQALNLEVVLGPLTATVSGCAFKCAGTYVLGIDPDATTDMQNNVVLRTKVEGGGLYPGSQIDTSVNNVYSDGSSIVGGLGVAFPQIRASAVSTTSGTSHSPTMPASVAADELLLAFGMANGNAGTLGHSGWTFRTAASSILLGLARKATGSGDALTMTSSTSRDIAWVVMAVTGWSGDVTNSITVAGTGSGLNPATVTPTWGADDTLYLAFYGQYGGTLPTITAVSTGYTEVGQITGDFTTDNNACVAYLDSTDTSSDPDTATSNVTPTVAGSRSMGIEPGNFPAASPSGEGTGVLTASIATGGQVLVTG